MTRPTVGPYSTDTGPPSAARVYAGSNAAVVGAEVIDLVTAEVPNLRRVDPILPGSSARKVWPFLP